MTKSTLEINLQQVPKTQQRAKKEKKKNSDKIRGLSRNPGSRGNVALSLTKSQFTATSPLTLFEIIPASTPGGTRVRGRELIASLSLAAPSTGLWTAVNGTIYTGAGFLFLPIMPSIFPRLSAYTPIYEYYKFVKCNFLFQSNQPTTSPGTFIHCVDYDPTDPAPTNSIAMMRNVTSVISNVYSDSSMQLLGSLSRLPRYETILGVASAETLQQVQGNWFGAVEGFTGAVNAIVGNLIVEYDIEFFTPQ